MPVYSIVFIKAGWHDLSALFNRNRHCVFSDLESTDSRKVLLEVKTFNIASNNDTYSKIGCKKTFYGV